MAGHSQFKNIMYRKGAQDAKRAKIFTKIIRELTVAAKTGQADPNANPRLRAAITLARQSNMSRDTMERAIKRGAGGEDNTAYDEVRYEGYGPGGIAVIVEALTDNRNRTASNVRSIFTKAGGALGETGSVSFSFDHVGEITYKLSVGDADKVMEAAIEAGADDVESDEEGHWIYTSFEGMSEVTAALEKSLGEADSVKAIWRPQNNVAVDAEKGAALMRVIGLLEDDDDVQNVYSNFEMSEEDMAKLDA